MPLTVFNSQLGNPTATTPSSLILSLTGAGNDVRTLGTSVDGTQPVKYVAFNSIAAGSLNSVTATLSVFPGTVLRVDTAYNGATFGIVYGNNTSSLFTVNTGTALQVLTANNFNTIVPEMSRLWNLTND